MSIVKATLNSKSKLTEKQKKSLEKLKDRPVDCSDIPEQTDEELKLLKKARKVTINLNEEVITFFKKQAVKTGIPYQTLINLYLSDCVKNNKTPELIWN